MNNALEQATASEIADLLENGGVPIDQVTVLCRRSIELLREYATLANNKREVSAGLSDEEIVALLGMYIECWPELGNDGREDVFDAVKLLLARAVLAASPQASQWHIATVKRIREMCNGVDGNQIRTMLDAWIAAEAA
jgi:hypothetical protein